MRLCFVALIILLSSFISFAQTTNIRGLDISGKTTACSIVDIGSDIGRVACWGRNTFPVFLDGSNQKAFVPILLPPFSVPVIQVATGLEHACVLLQSGEVQCWGNNIWGQLGLGHNTPAYFPTTVNLPYLATKIFVGSGSSCALLSSGETYCWGNNFYGELGLGNNLPFLNPTKIPFLNIKAISIGIYASCLISETGEVFCSGENISQLLGVPIITASNTYISNGVTGATQLNVGIFHACATLSSGEVKCWGAGNLGQLGNGSNPTVSIPVTVLGISNALEVTATQESACARLSSGDVSCWGSAIQQVLGSNGGNTNIPRTATGISDVIELQSGRYEVCANRSTGSMTCWGRALEGLLGDNGNSRNRLNALVDFSFTNTYNSFQSIILGNDVTFGIFNNGTVRTAGDNTHRLLGYGSTGQFSTSVSNANFLDTNTVAPSSLIHVGSEHVCSTKVGGGIECWGRNTYGQVGSSSLTLRPDPVQVYATDIVQKMQSLAFSNCALLNNGTVECWGRNHQGQLGEGSVLTFTSTPNIVPGLTGVVDLNCSKFSNSCCATKADNSIKCWGQNDFGQLGVDPSQNSKESIPVTVPWGQNATSITMGSAHTCYIDNQGRVFCFGKNTQGMLGDGTIINSTVPREVELPLPAAEVRAGDTHTCALLLDARLFCWGDNTSNRVGGGSPTVTKPSQIFEDVIHFDLGSISTCALDSKRAFWCWGRTIRGSFGNGSLGIRTFPTPINYKKIKD